ncbi:Non-specific serine/threonine protein kinase [Bertholletia excelsa]
METRGILARTASGGVILGKYRLGRLLGRGSFAKVYQARSLCDGNPVAVKVIDKATTVDASMEPRIIREVAAMRRLSSHPNILKIHEVMATKTKIYLVMELAAGGDLTDEIRRRGGRFTEPTARKYFRSSCPPSTSPQNLLLSGAGRVLKISDFGLSALPEQRRQGLLLHTACGTPAFTAPEILHRRGAAAHAGGYDGTKADAWSCGVILFVFLAGHLPFDDSNLAAMYRKIRRREFSFPNWVSKPSRQLIRQLLDPNPDTRMSIESLMGHTWFKKSPSFDQFEHCSPQLSLILNTECKISTKTTINAFDIISMSSGLDLSGLFETTNSQRERRFTSKESVEGITERVVKVGERLGYKIEQGKGRTLGLLKDRVVLLVEIWVMAPELALVEIAVIDGGGLEFEELYWEDLRCGFEDIALCWHSDVS